MVLNLVWFLWVVRNFEYKEVEHPSMRTAPPTTYKPPAWAQPQVVSGVQPANVGSTYSSLTPLTQPHMFCGCQVNDLGNKLGLCPDQPVVCKLHLLAPTVVGSLLSTHFVSGEGPASHSG